MIQVPEFHPNSVIHSLQTTLVCEINVPARINVTPGEFYKDVNVPPGKIDWITNEGPKMGILQPKNITLGRFSQKY